MYHIFCVHSSVDGHLGYFHVLDVVNSASVSIGGTCIFWDYSILQVYAQEWDCWVMYMVVLFLVSFFFPIYFYQLEANYSAILQWFFPYIDMNQPWIYMYTPSRSPLPIFSFLRNLCMLFSIVVVPVYIPTDSVGFSFLHTLSSRVYCLLIF